MVTTQNTKPATPDQPPKSDVRIEKFSRNLRVELTAEELTERAREAARLVQDIDQKTEDQAAAAKQAKAQIAELTAEHRRISEEVRVGATYKQVSCERHFIFRTGTVQELRMDTRKVLAERAMTDRERQLDLGLELPTSNGHKNGEAEEEDESEEDDDSEPAAASASDDDDDFGIVEELEPPLPTQKKRGRPRKGAKPS